MKKLINILFSLVVVVIFTTAVNAQTIAVANTSAAANSFKTNGITYSFSVNSISMGYAVVKNTNPQNNNLSQQNNTDSKIKIAAYPNPFTTTLKITYPQSDLQMHPIVKMVNASGKSFNVNFSQIDDGTLEIFVENLPQGTYVVYICDGKKTYSIKAVKL